MKQILLTLMALLTVNLAIGQHHSRHSHHHYPDTIRVACVGNSITEGFGLNDKKTEAYPARLQQMLGDQYLVLNAGLSGHTLMQKTDRPYITPTKTKRHPFHDALEFMPDIVTIKLGTNDSKTPYDSLLHADFVNDLHALIDSFEMLPSRPYIYLLLPIPAVGEVWTIRDSVIEQEILPRIRAVAQERDLPVIDLYSVLKPFPELLQDKIHPGAGGAMIIAEEIARRIQLDKERGIIHFGGPEPCADQPEFYPRRHRRSHHHYYMRRPRHHHHFF